jgi:transposase InsO family protein
MWQTDFTYFKIVGWEWMYLSDVLDYRSRYIIAWKLCTTMRAEDVTDTLEFALEASGCDHTTVRHEPKLLTASRTAVNARAACFGAIPKTGRATLCENGRDRAEVPPSFASDCSSGA